MTAWSCWLVRAATALLVAAWGLAGTGCVSSRYRLAPPAGAAPPAKPLALTASAPTAAATLQSVIVFHGPGSWKQDAYWDEYVVALAAPGAHALTLDRVTLIDRDGRTVSAGTDPWTLDAASREQLKVAKRSGRDIALGAGAGAAWLGSMALFVSNVTPWGVAGTSSAAVGAAGLVAVPVLALGTGIRNIAAQRAITREFNQRCIGVPVTIPAGSSRTGSFFFPVTPGPAQLVLRCHDGAGATCELKLDLTPLAGLHLKPAARE